MNNQGVINRLLIITEQDMTLKNINKDLEQVQKQAKNQELDLPGINDQ